MSIFGGCLGKDVRQHRRCKVTSGKRVCECKCEDHGVDYVKPDINTPMHLLLMEIAKEHGYNINDENQSEVDVEGDDKQSGEVSGEETIEQLEEKRKA